MNSLASDLVQIAGDRGISFLETGIQIARDVRRLQRYCSFRWETRNAAITIPDTPIFAPQDDQWFREQLAKTEFYLEFGTGASTLLAAQARVTTIAVESDPHFVEALKQALPPDHDITVIAADVGLTGAWGYPVFTRKTSKRLDGWRSYTSDAFDLLNTKQLFPDFILVDGRFRTACALASAANAAKQSANTTIMFDDYAGRAFYHYVEEYLGKPEMMERAAIFKIANGVLEAPISLETLQSAQEDFR